MAARDKQIRYTLTTHHTASSYGAPVLVDRDGTAYGPADSLPDGTLAADIARQLGGPLVQPFLDQMPSRTPQPDQRRHVQHQHEPLTGLRRVYDQTYGHIATDLVIQAKGKARRHSDGALTACEIQLTQDRWGTLRSWITVPIDPASGALVGNLLNAQHLHPVGSGWIHAEGPVTRTESDHAWDALGLLGQVTCLLQGRIMADHGGNLWDVLIPEGTLQSAIHSFSHMGITPGPDSTDAIADCSLAAQPGSHAD